MANPTTNYGFVLPTPTDLVTDLPADFEVALQGVDTQMKTNADAAIAKTIVDAKGDLIAATGADAVSRLAIGTNDQVLTADSTTATGMKWATSASGSMTLLSTTTLSGTSTTVSSISGSYLDLLVYINAPVTNANATMRILPNSTTSIGINTGVIAGGFENNNQIQSATNALTTGSSNSAYCLLIRRYANTSNPKPITFIGGQGSGTTFTVNQAGYINTNSAITALQFTTSAGTATFSSGTVLIYGVN
jgi:hypothetical protein